VQGPETLVFVDTKHNAETTTCFPNTGDSNTACQLFDNWEPSVFDAAQQATVYLEYHALENRARVRADMTPPKVDAVEDGPSIEYTSSYALQMIADDNAIGNNTVSEASNFVHYTLAVTEYIHTLVLCSEKGELWTNFKLNRNLLAVREIAPCKLYQKGRDSFVILHAAELRVPTPYPTVIALFKTNAGRNRFVDVQTANNLRHLSFITDGSLVTNTNEFFQDARLVDTQTELPGTAQHQNQSGSKPQQVHVVDGLAEDRLFVRIHKNARSCNLSREWNPTDTTEPRATENIEKQLPCFLSQQLGTFMRQVTYFRALNGSGVYATYENPVLSSNSMHTYKSNVVANVSKHFQSIMRSRDASATLL